MRDGGGRAVATPAHVCGSQVLEEEGWRAGRRAVGKTTMMRITLKIRWVLPSLGEKEICLCVYA